jgi:hypothetical protein
LFTTDIAPLGGLTSPQYAVTADGERFLGLERVGGGKAFTFLLNSLDAKSDDATTVRQLAVSDPWQISKPDSTLIELPSGA